VSEICEINCVWFLFRSSFVDKWRIGSPGCWSKIVATRILRLRSIQCYCLLKFLLVDATCLPGILAWGMVYMYSTCWPAPPNAERLAQLPPKFCSPTKPLRRTNFAIAVVSDQPPQVALASGISWQLPYHWFQLMQALDFNVMYCHGNLPQCLVFTRVKMIVFVHYSNL